MELRGIAIPIVLAAAMATASAHATDTVSVSGAGVPVQLAGGPGQSIFEPPSATSPLAMLGFGDCSFDQSFGVAVCSTAEGVVGLSATKMCFYASNPILQGATVLSSSLVCLDD